MSSYLTQNGFRHFQIRDAICLLSRLLVLLGRVVLRVVDCPKGTVHLLIDLKRSFKKCESIFQFLNKMQLCCFPNDILCWHRVCVVSSLL